MKFCIFPDRSWLLCLRWFSTPHLFLLLQWSWKSSSDLRLLISNENPAKIDFRVLSNITQRLRKFNNLNQSFHLHDNTFAFQKSALRVLHTMHWQKSFHLSIALLLVVVWCKHFPKLPKWLKHQCLISQEDFKRSSQNIRAEFCHKPLLNLHLSWLLTVP